MKDAGAYGVFQGKRFKTYVSYPNAHFFGDEVVLLYDFGPQLDPSTDPPSWPRHRKIVIRPIEWLYEEI